MDRQLKVMLIGAHPDDRAKEAAAVKEVLVKPHNRIPARAAKTADRGRAERIIPAVIIKGSLLCEVNPLFCVHMYRLLNYSSSVIFPETSISIIKSSAVSSIGSISYFPKISSSTTPSLSFASSTKLFTFSFADS